MGVTACFLNDVLAKRPYLMQGMCRKAIESAVHREVQADGRIRHWSFDTALGKWLRVVTLADGVTIHNAFPDRGFKP